MERYGVIMAVEVNHIWYRYPSGKNYVVQDCSFTLEKGEVVALLGASGEGKSTFARLISGYLTPEKGSIVIDGQPVPIKGFQPVQLIYQHPEKAINPKWKLQEVLWESTVLSEDCLREYGIEDAWLTRFPRELSGGELQRFCIARALESRCSYVLCDEMSTMLDAITQAQLWKIVLKQARNKQLGVLVITHDRQLAERVADRIVLLKEINGKKEDL